MLRSAAVTLVLCALCICIFHSALGAIVPRPSTTCCSAAGTSSIPATARTAFATWRSASGAIAAVAPRIDPAGAAQTIDVSGLYVTPGLVDIHTHVYAGTGEPNSYAGDNSVYPDGFTFRAGVTTVVDAGGSGWRNFDDFKSRVITGRARASSPCSTSSGTGCAAAQFEQDLADMEPQPTAEAARRNRGVVVGIKTAHYAGPEWAPVERAVQAGTAADIPVMVDFGRNRPERPLAELLTTQAAAGRHLHARLFRASERARSSGSSQPRAVRGTQAGRDLRRRTRRRQLPLARRRAGRAGGLPARLDLDRPAHRQHERGDEGHAERDEQVPRARRAARRGDPAIDVEPRARDAAGVRSATCPPARPPTSPCCASRRGTFGFVDSYGARMQGDQRLVCELTIRDGKVVYDLNGISTPEWTTLPAEYGAAVPR